MGEKVARTFQILILSRLTTLAERLPGCSHYNITVLCKNQCPGHIQVLMMYRMCCREEDIFYSKIGVFSQDTLHNKISVLLDTCTPFSSYAMAGLVTIWEYNMEDLGYLRRFYLSLLCVCVCAMIISMQMYQLERCAVQDAEFHWSKPGLGAVYFLSWSPTDRLDWLTTLTYRIEFVFLVVSTVLCVLNTKLLQ